MSGLSAQKTALKAICDTGELWKDSGHPGRTRSVEKTLGAPNRFTRQGIEYALECNLHQLTMETLSAWATPQTHGECLTIGVLNAGNIPLVGLQDVLACVLAGHRYRGVLSSRSPFLLPAFCADLGGQADVDVRFRDLPRVLEGADAIIASGTAETLAVIREKCEKAGIPQDRRLLRRPTYSVAILQGTETQQEYLQLAEDCVLHEGQGCRNVAIVFAPAYADVDPFLAALDTVRQQYPPHAQTPGSLEMTRAFLEATSAPHASGPGFLVSKGPPRVQQPCHIRWSEYQDVTEVQRWIGEHAPELQLVVSAQGGDVAGPHGPEGCVFGATQCPRLDWRPDGIDPLWFLSNV
jgi:hypothetical protein